MSSDLQNDMLFAHQANIERYRRLLTTDLTDNEREFVERRLNEEADALRTAAQSVPFDDCPDAA